MNQKEFERIIVFEELAQTDDTFKFMLKTYLNCLLAGGKIRENAFLYSVGAITKNPLYGKIIPEDKPLETFSIPLELEIKARKEGLIKLFNQMKKDKFWVMEDDETIYYDKNGDRIDPFKEPKGIISKKEEIHTKITFFLDKRLDIKDLRDINESGTTDENKK